MEHEESRLGPPDPDFGMLSMKVKTDEIIRIGDNISLLVAHVHGSGEEVKGVRFIIRAPKSVQIHRDGAKRKGL